MEKRIVQFKGMTNVPDDGINEAGDMSVLLNMRHKGGELVPAKKDKVFDVGGMYTIKKAKFHNGMLLELNYGGKLQVRKEYDKAYDDELGKTFNSLKVEDFDVMGNIVVMSLKNSLEYAIWRNERFEYLGALPEVPDMGLEKNIRREVVQTPTVYSYDEEDFDYGSKWIKHSKGYFDKCLDLHYKKGRYIDNVLFIVALKLFDGSYKYSQLYLVRDDEGDANFIARTYERFAGEKGALMEVQIDGIECVFKFNYSLLKWKDIIKSVCVFSSGSIMGCKPVKKNVYSKYSNPNIREFEDLGVCEFYAKKMMFEIREEIEQWSTFYKVAEFDLEGRQKFLTSDTSPSGIANMDALTESQTKTYLGGRNFVYNGRIHLYDYQEQVCLAGNNVFFKPGNENETSTGEKKSSLELENGDVIEYNVHRFPYDERVLPELISHPQSGVKRQIVENTLEIHYNEHPVLDMSLCLNSTKELDYRVDCICVDEKGDTFVTEYDNGEAFYCFFELDVEKFLSKTECRLGDYVFKYHRDSVWRLNGGDVTSISDYGISFKYKYGVYGGYANTGSCIYINVSKSKTKYDIARFTKIIGNLPVESQTLKKSYKKELKVSALDNPFVFPETQTYMFEGDIVGVASNTDAISQGQFGQYPLYVFTTQGIWAMQVDTSGKTAYSMQSPLSREVCLGEVVAFDKGVAFTTQKGVMAISGGQVAELSAALDGFEELLFNNSGSLVGKIFERAGYNGDNEYNGYKDFEPVPIRVYIDGAKLAYSYNDNSLLLFNETYYYAYLYDLKNGVWSACDGMYKLRAENLGPKGELLLYTDDLKRFVFGGDDDARPVVAITRPFTLGSFDYKRLRQAALRTTFTGSLNFYLLGSNDGANFVCITGKEYPSKNASESMNVTRRDLITAMSRSKQYKYFAIAIAGNMKGRVSLAELLVDAGFANNKLR